jgi:hypothetical protein
MSSDRIFVDECWRLLLSLRAKRSNPEISADCDWMLRRFRLRSSSYGGQARSSQ